MDSQHFGPAAIICSDRFTGCMQAKIRPHLRDIFYLCARRDAHPKIIIHCKVKGWVQRADFAPQIAAKERGLLRDVNVSLTQAVQVRLRGGEPADDLSAFVDVIRVAVNQTKL